ncbi:MAG: hypothetical protein J5986_00300 [Roseburia sp.]|nr:hypothetical protein [Roseburia sp.]
MQVSAKLGMRKKRTQKIGYNGRKREEHACLFGERRMSIMCRICDTESNPETVMSLSKEEKILDYIRKNGSISSQKAASIGGYKSKSGARKLLDKMMADGVIQKVGNGPSTKYIIKEGS